MTASGFGVILSLYLLPALSMGATITSERKSVIRAEPQRVEMTHRGEIHQSKKELIKLGLGQDYCNYDFPLGQANVAPGNCTEGNESLILSEDMCIKAADRADAGMSSHYVIEDEAWENARPKGCFKFNCAASESANQICYFYNGIGDWPDATLAAKHQETFAGTPVCSRPKIALGTNDTNAQCPGGYKAITGDDINDQLQHENMCYLTANCLSDAQGDEFRIGEQNASKHLDFPRGCFIDNDNLVGGGAGKVYFNPKTAEGFGADGVVKGTPICKVDSGVKWDASGTQTTFEYTGVDSHSLHDKARHDAGDRDAKAVAAANAAPTPAPPPAASPAASPAGAPSSS